MVKEGLIDEKTAVLRVPANDLTQLLLPSFKPTARNAADVLGRGPARFARCRGWQVGVHRRRSRGTRRRWREGAPGS